MRSWTSIWVCCLRKSLSYSSFDHMQSLHASMELVVRIERMKFGSMSPPQPQMNMSKSGAYSSPS